MTNQSNSTQDTEDVVAPRDDEELAWEWLSAFSQRAWGEDPADCEFSADQMVDAYMAGRQSLSDRIDGLTQALRDIERMGNCGLKVSSDGIQNVTEVARAALHQEATAP